MSQPIRLGIVVLSLVVVGDSRAAQPPVATFEGRVASVTPSGDNQVGDPSDASKRSKHEGKTSKHEKDDAKQSPCALQSGSILACATTLEGEEEPTCSPVRESDCEFSVEVPLEQEADVAGLFFVQDDDGSEEPDRDEAEAELIDEQKGAPVCNDDVFRVDEVNVDFAQAAPSADSIEKIVDTCTES